MGETAKTVCALFMMVAGLAGALAWGDDRPDDTTWLFRFAGPAVAGLSLVGFLVLHFRHDLEQDYLREVSESYFNRDGFCFAFMASAADGVAYMDAYFQGQFDSVCTARLKLRPSAGLFSESPSESDLIEFDIVCPPGGFGFARVAIGIPKKYQGRRRSFDVGASVEYPEGKGQRIRFRDGVYVRSNHEFASRLGTAIKITRVLGGNFLPSEIVNTVIDLPSGVVEQIDHKPTPDVRILWELGKPSLNEFC